MRFRTLVLTGILIGGLQACSPGGESAAPEPSPAEPQHVWKEQVRALEKAQNLEGDMNHAWQQRNREIDSQAR